MKNKIDLIKVVSISEMQGDDAEDSAKLVELHKEAREYLKHFSWCGHIIEEYFGIGVGGIVGVFLFKIKPAKPEVDEWLWVIVGDLPPAYIVIDRSPNPALALNSYIMEMSKWVKAVKEGLSVENLIPVNVPPTIEYANMLAGRLKFIKREILSYYTDDLKKI